MGKRNRAERMLTEVELELMNVIWKTPTCTVRAILEQLPKSRSLAYTSVATMMKILAEKGFLKSESHDRTHTFRPLITREEYERRTLSHVAERLFDGNSSSMVMRLLNESELSQEELKNIKKILEERLRT